MTLPTANRSETAEVLPRGETLRVEERSLAILWLLAGSATVLGLVLMLVGPGTNSQLRGSLRPVLGMAWIGFGAMMALAARSGLVVSNGGITVKGMIRKRYWGWNEVRKFELVPTVFVPWLKVTLSDGRQVRVRGFEGKSDVERQLAGERIAALNHRAEARGELEIARDPSRRRAEDRSDRRV